MNKPHYSEVITWAGLIVIAFGCRGQASDKDSQNGAGPQSSERELTEAESKQFTDANQAFLSGQYDDAITGYTRLLRSNPSFSNAIKNRGIAWRNKGDYDKSIADFDEAIRLRPSYSSAYSERGITWLQKGEVKNAMADHDKAIGLNPLSAPAYSNRGEAWRFQREFDKALADYNKAIRLFPHPIPFDNRGIVWVEKEEYEKALADYAQALELNPKYAEAYCNRGNCYCWLGKLDLAIDDYNEAIRLAPSFSGAYRNRGTLWYRTAAYDKALNDFDKAIRLDPKFTKAYENRARLLAASPDAKLRDGRRAIKDATKACELSKWGDASCVSTLAAAYAEVGDFEKAVDYQEKAIKLATEKDKKDLRSRLNLYRSGEPYRSVDGTP